VSFHEWWQEQQAQKMAARQAAVEQAGAWIGRRVWCRGPDGPLYGEIERIDERGVVSVVIGYNRQDQPLYLYSDVELLGRSITLAEG
jgi:hypothetical protein